MEGKRFIRRIKVQNLLSFDEEGIDLELEPLNVLIGPNGSGKSNLIDVFKVLRATRNDLTQPFTSEGGLPQWLHFGKKSGVPTATISTAIEIDNCTTVIFRTEEDTITAEGNDGPNNRGVNIFLLSHYDYCLRFSVAGQKLSASREYIAGEIYTDPEHVGLLPKLPLLYLNDNGSVTLKQSRAAQQPLHERDIKSYVQRLQNEVRNQSVLSRLRDPFNFPEIEEVGKLFGDITIFQQWTMGRSTEARIPQPADLPGDHLYEDNRNLGAVLNEMKRPYGLYDKLVDTLKGLYPRITHVEVLTLGGTVQVYFREEGARELIPATRLSDGTMRFLCMLAVLLHPSPPPLVCIEEPELGLHPDMIHKVAELLKEASTRMQLIVTTHSDLLVSALADMPEAMVVCEHDGEGTRMKRLEPGKIREWLDRYSLGDLWLKGEIGGTRW